MVKSALVVRTFLCDSFFAITADYRVCVVNQFRAFPVSVEWRKHKIIQI